MSKKGPNDNFFENQINIAIKEIIKNIHHKVKKEQCILVLKNLLSKTQVLHLDYMFEDLDLRLFSQDDLIKQPFPLHMEYCEKMFQYHEFTQRDIENFKRQHTSYEIKIETRIAIMQAIGNAFEN